MTRLEFHEMVVNTMKKSESLNCRKVARVLVLNIYITVQKIYRECIHDSISGAESSPKGT